MAVKLLTEHNLDFLSLTGGCTGSSESTLVNMPHCWKSHVTAHLFETLQQSSKLELQYVNHLTMTVIQEASTMTTTKMTGRSHFITFHFYINGPLTFSSR